MIVCWYDKSVKKPLTAYVVCFRISTVSESICKMPLQIASIGVVVGGLTLAIRSNITSTLHRGRTKIAVLRRRAFDGLGGEADEDFRKRIRVSRDKAPRR